MISAREAAEQSKERLKTRDSRRIESKVSEILANADTSIRIAVSNGDTRVLFGYDIWEADLYHIIQDRVKKALVELGYDVTLYGKAIEVRW